MARTRHPAAAPRPARTEPPQRFAPVPQSSPRADGWTSDRQHAFIAALARTGVVAAAARSVGMTARSANQLRLRAGAESGFARAWAAAVGEGQMRALDFALEQSFAPDMVAIMRGGRQVGWRTRDAGRLAFAALQALDGLHERFGQGAGASTASRNEIASHGNNISERSGKSGSSTPGTDCAQFPAMISSPR